ncbi:MAG: hypothetical protein QME44_03895 [Thermodesulfobacteriota bacterium]|nr:hypothetical protein [Thermodesulfobacteriota bacterium]
MRVTIFLMLSVFALTCCAPAIRTTTFQKLSPKPADAPIKVYRFKTPQCDFVEIGIINSRQRNKFISMDEVMNSLIVEARKMGGDAIIGLNETNPIYDVDQYGIDRDPVLSGTVIRFTDPNCMY